MENRDNGYQEEINFWKQVIDGTHPIDSYNQNLRNRVTGKIL